MSAADEARAAAAWEPVIGLEVHVQLRTERKLFCGDRVVFGDEPNTHVCPVCLGLPGALPATNPEAVALAIRTALALGCTVHGWSIWARKNYFYPDLPKGYQITQLEHPIATDGVVAFEGGSGASEVRIRRAHMEEDAGKSIHDRIRGATAVDLNRTGTPLMEIVTEPDLRSPADVRAFLGTLKQMLEYADVSDCNMEEGSLRVDANVSVRRRGARELGAKTEIKNVNSFSGVEKAIELEIDRQSGILEAGGRVEQETLLWDDHRSRLRAMRSKEDSHDYRYFPDPDLPPLVISAAAIDAARDALPELPASRRERCMVVYDLSAYDAGVLTQSRATADYFESVAEATGEAKSAANWVMGPAQAL
ncbi:MAG TPA: Asp-tRNA(Asn)/Glu-tRNA(Gln) amidotransferase subunit GatB, partial [Longimicrobiales bacterium]|nr:Asp-tRNA(Asn)/Glu-tRNA(Gln) amidotransferase subunit GatB [Longimicrobiales bacterium]